MKTQIKNRRKGIIHKGLAAAFGVLLGALVMVPVLAAPGGTILNGTSSGIPFAGFLFEPEVPFTSLKNAPTWDELEQMMLNPYAVTVDPATPGNDQGFPSYRSNIVRRPASGLALPQFLVHPLNYNTTTGEEMRLLNPNYPGGTFNVTDQLVQCSSQGAPAAPAPNGCGGTITVNGPTGPVTSGPFDQNRWVWVRMAATISPGAGRVTEPSIDYNNPVAADTSACVVVTEFNPPEGSILCGGDPGEPNYAGFSVFNSNGYSTPAIRNVASPGTPISAIGTGNHRLFDPAGCGARNAVAPGSCVAAGFLTRLKTPTLRPNPNAQPNYLKNSVATLAANGADTLVASNENDYIQGNNPAQKQAARAAAIRLGKALFWDMQVGSDGVQSCGTCHFNGTGTDTRVKNQLNPNHLGGDLTFQLRQPNETLTLADFPLHKLTNPEVAGDPACMTPLTADVSAIPYAATPAGYASSQRFSNPVTGTVTVCDSTNTVSDVNDVVSSMGVVYNHFSDIAAIGAFQPLASGVQAVMPDLRTDISLDPDPIPGFQGLRRVEPRNTPTMQAGGFNFDNFWDGRARHDFNGGSVFGAADPQAHVFVNNSGTLVPTKQLIRFTSIASLATGPGLSEFEMSFQGRNWAKVGKKLLQGTVAPSATSVTPLANQLVDATDSVLGPWSNQGGSQCATLGRATAPGKPGLCTTYQEMIQAAFYPQLWQNTSMHLNGCYTDGNLTLHPNQCAGTPAIPILDHTGGDLGGTLNETNTADPFDGYVLTPASGAATAADTNQLTQMQANFSLFWGLAIQQWVNILVPDNTPFDQVLDANPGAFAALGEPGEPGLVEDQLICGQSTPVTGDVNDPNFCFTEVGNFKRDPDVVALRRPTGEGGTGGTLVPSPGTRQAGAPDPLLGMDIFFASNLSLKNPNFRTGRCGECHAIPTLTDHTMPFTSKINLMDAVAEFVTPGIELTIEPLARLRVITGFLLESEINENGQDAVERRIVDQSLVPNPTDGLAYPGATAGGLPGFGAWTGADSAFLDNGVYNLGIRPIAEDVGRGGNDPFGWPLSLSVLMMKNLAGPEFNPGGDDPLDNFAQPAAPGIALPSFDPDLGTTGGLFEETAQDQQINPGFEGEPAEPQLPPYLAAFANNITVGDFPPELDEAGGAIGGMLNTLTDIGIIEGFMDTLGPFNPANIAAEVMNYGGFSDRPGDINNQMGTWPNVNRVQRMGSFKAAPLRNVELTGPYFHNGGKLTLRQVVDFYVRGGDFPISNAAHRDFNLVNMNAEIQSNLSEEEEIALVDFLLELTDERNRFDKAPFDHPEVIIPVDGAAPDNTGGRAALLAAVCGTGPCFQDVPAVGAAGMATPEPAFLNVTKVRVSGVDANPGSPQCNYATGPVSHYCH